MGDLFALTGVIFTVAVSLYAFFVNKTLKKVEREHAQKDLNASLEKIETDVKNADLDELIAKNNARYGAKRKAE